MGQAPAPPHFIRSLSPEVRVLLHPGEVFRAAARQQRRSAAWVMLRRPLAFALTIGCAISLATSGRLTLRLVAGEALAWSVLPFLEAASLLAVGWTRRRAVPFSRQIDLFFLGNSPWLLWLMVTGAALSFLSPMQSNSVLGFFVEWPVLILISPALLWSGYIDYRFFRSVHELTPARATRRLLAQRAIAWGAGIVYLFWWAGFPLLAERLGL